MPHLSNVSPRQQQQQQHIIISYEIASFQMGGTGSSSTLLTLFLRPGQIGNVLGKVFKLIYKFSFYFYFLRTWWKNARDL